ncbi:hypothetical protein [Hymenobacter psychrotolerans]|uniref:hypothetical protein n=1 Tax=Hymenobacter psychrotolerans TaxID=344998 RepID=UPI00147E4AEE|nr:hypothetical protein [Hymenobacter psychrotolerans]
MKEQSQIMSYSTLEATRSCLVEAGAVQLALSISQILAGTPFEKKTVLQKHLAAALG